MRDKECIYRLRTLSIICVGALAKCATDALKDINYSFPANYGLVCSMATFVTKVFFPVDNYCFCTSHKFAAPFC